jgi:hypothetical protein
MRRVIGGVMVALAAWLWAGPAQAIFLDHERTLEVTGKVLGQVSLRTENSDSSGTQCFPFGAYCEGFTFPEVKTGQMIQERNLIDVEAYHDLRRWAGPGSALAWFNKLGYRFRVKYFYDSLYDFGPHQWSSPRTTATNGNAIPGIQDLLYQGLYNARHYDTQHDPIWNAYIEAGKGRFFLRIGRQDLSWGETDGFRLLDMIEPLDNRFGFPLVEDLDDRRIPLWMARGTINLGTWGPFSNATIDSYLVPGTIDNQVSPPTPSGNPFALPNPPGPSIISRPNKNMGNSRGGGRIIATIANKVTASIAHYVTYNDNPSARTEVYAVDAIPGEAIGLPPGTTVLSPEAVFLVDYYQQQITGGSATFALPFDPYTIIRSEFAQFWDERVFQTQENLGSFPAYPPAPFPNVGHLPTRNIARWMFGFDRNVWIRWLNPENTFFFSGQYFHAYMQGYEDNMQLAAAHSTQFGLVAPDTYATSFNFVNVKQNEVTFTYLINTLVYHGTITPQIFGAYDIRGVNTVVPSISYQIGSNIQLIMKYAFITGSYNNLGLFRDRDQLLFRVQYNLS